MRHIVSTCTRILGVLAMLIFFAGPLQADPVVILAAGGNNPIPIPAPNISIGTFVIDDNGRLTVVVDNGTSFTYNDLHIRISPTVNVPIRGEGLPFFEIFNPRPDGGDFLIGGGTGIRTGQTVSIIFSGFRPGTRVDVIATTDGGEIPEPASLLLLGTGIAGVVIKARRKLKTRKSG